jgi:2'-5' RNA ligase
MEGCDGASAPINSFSLVAYLPAPLAGFVDALRRDIQPGCDVRGHVTILPPRPLPCSADAAWDQLQSALQHVQPFRVRLGEVRVFAVTQVIHLAIEEGAAELVELHRDLSQGCLEFQETYYYHPHVTLAQWLAPKDLLLATHTSVERWKAYTGPRDFVIDRLTLVQNTDRNRWMNLREYVLHTPVAA